MTNSELFNAGAEQLRNVGIALDPYGRTKLDGYALILVDNEGSVHFTEKAPSDDSVDAAYLKGLEFLKNTKWNKVAQPNTPSVEMVLRQFFPELDVKAYAMWASSSTGATAQTHAVYKSLSNEEQTKICDTIETSIELRNQNTTFTMR